MLRTHHIQGWFRGLRMVVIAEMTGQPRELHHVACTCCDRSIGRWVGASSSHVSFAIQRAGGEHGFRRSNTRSLWE